MKKTEKGYRKAVRVMLMLAMMIVAGVLYAPDTGAAEREENGFKYNVTDNGKGVYIYGYTGSDAIIEVPSQINGQDVLSIVTGAFENCTTLEEVTIPEGVLGIASSAFDGCTNLKTIRIPSTVEEFDLYLVACNRLEQLIVAPEHANYTSVDGVLFNKDITTLLKCPRGKKGSYTVPSTVTKIDFAAFECSGLTTVTVPEGVKNMGTYVFSRSSVKTVSLPDSLTAISDGMFYGCASLETMQIPAGVTKIGADAYGECENIQTIVVAEGNTNFTVSGNALFNKAKTQILYCSKGIEGKFSVPDTVTSIGQYAFSGCSKITEIAMPSKVTTISDAAFMGCQGLTSVTIPANVTSIGESAFSECVNLTSVTFNQNTKTIRSSAFRNCSKLEYVTLPLKLETIKKNAFHNCSNMVSVEISAENAKYVSIDGVLYNKAKTELVLCPSGKSDTLNLPEGITDLTPEKNGFFSYEILESCKKLTAITLPSTYAGFSDSIYRFAGCTALEEINVSGEHERFCSIDGVVYDKAVKSVIFCPMGRKKKYSMPDTVETISKYAFNGCKKLTDVTVSSHVKKIDANCFNNCVIDHVILSDGVEEIVEWAMEGSLIKKMYIPASVNRIADSAFGYQYDMGEMEKIKLEVQPVICCTKQSVAYRDALEKGLEVELVKQETEICFINYKPDKKYDGVAVVVPRAGQLAVTGANYDEVVFVWYRDCVEEGNKLTAAPVNAGTYILTAVLPERDDRKGCVVQSDAVKIEKAEQPSAVPKSVIQAPYADQKVKNISLPKNWAWKEGDREKDLPVGTPVTVTAEYIGNDKGNYKKVTIAVTITRQNTASEKVPAKEAVITDKKTKAVYTITKTGQKNGCVSYTGTTAKKAAKVTIPATVRINGYSYKVTAIDAGAFKNNKKITRIVIGKLVEKIGKKAFYGCKKLKSIYIKTTKLKKKSVGSKAFAKIHGKAVIKVPKKKYAAYKKILKAKGVTGKRKIKK